MHFKLPVWRAQVCVAMQPTRFVMYILVAGVLVYLSDYLGRYVSLYRVQYLGSVVGYLGY